MFATLARPVTVRTAHKIYVCCYLFLCKRMEQKMCCYFCVHARKKQHQLQKMSHDYKVQTYDVNVLLLVHVHAQNMVLVLFTCLRVKSSIALRR